MADTQHPDDRVIRFALSGAAGGFARTLLAQARRMDRLTPAVLCDIDTDAVLETCAELGYDLDGIVVCRDRAEIAGAGDAMVVVADTELVDHHPHDILVEATGRPEVGYGLAWQAIESGRHVVLVSKELDSVAGVALGELARARGVVVTPAVGDQPANLLDWLARIRTLGLDVVAVGKSSEYDLVFDPVSGTLAQLDTVVQAPQLGELLTLGADVRDTLERREQAVAALDRRATADYCEMSVVCNYSGLAPSTPVLHYPVARPAELADIYALHDDGGILARSGVVDVFSALRLPGEASFAGGVFAVVKTHDPQTWETLRLKGHVVSRNGRYACLYLPYHFMGVETPISLIEAVDHHRTAGRAPARQHSVLASRAHQALRAGQEMTMGGHHHDVSGVTAELISAGDAPEDIAPLYLVGLSTLVSDIEPGHLITLDDLAGYPPELRQAWQAGLDVSQAG